MVVGIAVVVALLVGAAPAASAAGGVSVDVTPGTDDVQTGETTTFVVVVGNATGGVGGAELRVVVDDPSVASVTDVRIEGDPNVRHVEYASDNSAVDVAYAAANTSDGGDVRAVTVTVQGRTEGTTGISLVPYGDRDAINVYEESGAKYELAGVGGATLTVDDHHSNGGSWDPDSDSSGDTDGTTTDDATDAPPSDGSTSATTTVASDEEDDAAGDGRTDGTATDPVTTADAPSTTTDAGSGSTVTRTRMPGFTLGLALLALVAAGLVAARRE